MLTFELGTPEAPRGHALFYLRSSANPDAILVSYLVVLPVTVDIARYLPPFLAQGMGAEAGGLTGEQAAIPWPPIPESFESYERLRALALGRDDDLLFGGTVNPDQVEALIRSTGQAAQEYYQHYARRAFEALEAPTEARESSSDLDVDEVLFSLLGDHERLTELVKRTGVLRDAVEASDSRAIESAIADVRKLGRYLSEKYRVEDLLQAAQLPGERGRRLAELYVERCYRVVNEDYAGLQETESQIRELS
jgi:hypothetical protein